MMKFLQYFAKAEPTDNGFTVTKFILVAGSIALMLFGSGYALRGLGSVMEPFSDIVDELHDSSDTDSSDNTNST